MTSQSPQAHQIFCPETGEPIPEADGFTFTEPIRVAVNERLREEGCTPDAMPCTTDGDMFENYPGCPCYRIPANILNQLGSAGFVIRHEDD